MLKLKDIVKHYYVADLTVEALKGINVCFRKNEFVSILGPSGCGKTTLLNIIGGLDKYTSGDLTINGVSTKEFNDRDWDVYRNHRIGFIFQSYNLIPHQTVLGNVELALTISGISKAERVERAKKALDKVGLKDQYYKRPNQLSGGQCQRVAIARALVNEPEILLADEPTGALDTETSVQIMELIKEIASEKLVIMVTHNPDLAYKYSTRIVKFLDGELIDDSNPFSEEEEKAEIDAIALEEKKKDEEALALIDKNDTKAIKNYNKNKNAKEKAKMSFWTAFKLSARNLFSKFKRTAMVVVAGSIGIIGVSAVLAVSQGVRDYITSIQDDLLSGNPIAITKSGVDYNTLINSSSFLTQTAAVKESTEAGKVNVNSAIEYLVSNQKALDSLSFNNSFDENYVSYILSMPKEYYNAISLKYGMVVDYNIYTEYKASYNTNNPNYDLKKKFDRSISLNAINSTYSESLKHILESIGYADDAETYASLITQLTKPMVQSIDFDNNVYLKDQYELVAGSLPNDDTGDANTKEVLIVLDSDGLISDLTLAQLGYYSQEEFYNIIYNALNESTPNDGKEIYVNKNDIKKKFTYDELLNKTFRWYQNDSIFTKNGGTFDYKFIENDITNKTNSITLKPSGIVKLKDGISYGALKTGFLFSEPTARTFVNRNVNSVINNYIRDTLTKNNKKVNNDSLNLVIPYTLDYYWESTDETTAEIVPYTNHDDPTNESVIYCGESDMTSAITSFLSSDGSYTDLDSMMNMQTLFGNVSQEQMKELILYLKDPSKFGEMMTKIGSILKDSMSAQIAGLLGNKKVYLKTFGGSYLPNSINIYPVNFASKDKVTKYLDAWNDIDENSTTKQTLTFNKYNEDFSEVKEVNGLSATPESRQEIKYTDTVGIIINLINTMINIVTYALVAFTALSLVVSTVMIAIITYVSVMERVKEIGVIRSLGGRKKDVSHLFNAEAFIIGLISGIFGVIITYIIQIVANIIIGYVSGGVITVIANFTPLTALIMILVSILLTAISGLIPAKSAAKKDPVVALRTE